MTIGLNLKVEAAPRVLDDVREGERALTLLEIHERHADLAWASLQRFGVAPRDLDDALQEVFLVVHKKLDTLQHPSAVKSWLYGICLRVASDWRKRAHRRYETLQAEVPEAIEPNDPESNLARREAEARLAATLDAMSLERRSLLVMFEVDGLECSDIAAITGVPVGTVHSRLHAARAEFTKAAARLDARCLRRMP